MRLAEISFHTASRGLLIKVEKNVGNECRVSYSANWPYCGVRKDSN